MQRLVLFLFALCCFLAAVYGKGGRAGGGGRFGGFRSSSSLGSRSSSRSSSRCLKINLCSIARYLAFCRIGHDLNKYGSVQELRSTFGHFRVLDWLGLVKFRFGLAEFWIGQILVPFGKISFD